MPLLLRCHSSDWGTNPCCEIALRPFQFCNLCEVNVSDIETQEEFIENRNTENRTKKQLKDNAYQTEINYLNSFDNSLQEFPNLIEEYSEGELDIEEVKEELGFVYELKLDKLAEDPLVNITRLKNKTKNHIECLIDKIENL